MPSPWPDLTDPYAHAWTEIHKGIDTQGPYYKVTYYFEESWATADQMVNELLGFATKSGQSIFWQGPHQYPLDPTGRSLCYQADVVGVGAPQLNSDGYPMYSNGFFIDALYRVPPVPMYPQQDPENLIGIDPATPLLWASQELDFDNDFIILEKSSYKFASDGTTSTVPVRVELGITTMVITFHRVPYMPTSLIRSMRGQVNNAVFMGAAAGNVLFKGCRTKMDWNTDGSYTKSIQCIFQERTQAWNKVFRPDTLTWDTLQDGSGNGPYVAGNLSNLLVQAQAYAVTS
jgi:hypothetical protein